MPEKRIGLFTIASKNYLAYARVLLQSVARFHPNYRLFLCLVDEVSGKFDPEREPFTIISAKDLGIESFDDMRLRYDVMELNTAVKPFVFEHLFEKSELDALIYLDPDIRLYFKMGLLESVLDRGASVVLTPHITRPLEDGRSPDDLDIVQAGVFNLGFIAVSRGDEGRRFVRWWAKRLTTGAAADLSQGLFTDQKWCNLAPALVGDLHILKYPGYNVAYWNLNERTLESTDGMWLSNGVPLVFYHFSGVNVEKPDILSKHQNRFSFSDLPLQKTLGLWREDLKVT